MYEGVLAMVTSPGLLSFQPPGLPGLFFKLVVARSRSWRRESGADRQINQWLVVFANSLGVIAIRSAINGERNANANGHELRAASTADHCGH